MFSHHFQMMILGNWRIILRNGWRIFFLTFQITITSLYFPTCVKYWENWIHLWALNFRSQNSPVWHMFLKYICQENENEYQINERFFSHNKPNKNNLSNFYYICHIFGESNPSLSPKFQILEFPCLTHVFEIQMSGKWKWSSNN